MTYGDLVPFALMLSGSFDPGYLVSHAAEGIDWAWQHRIGDLDGVLF